jgi:predicted GH43/DUF377 family glycosyl hydrolase
MWKKGGLIFNPEKKFSWAKNFALQPTPILIDDVLRVYCGFRDDKGVSRIGYVELNPRNPAEVLGWSKLPVLDIGDPGCFDENGVVPCKVLKVGNDIYMYYAGYQLGNKIKFTVYGGLAVSKDQGKTFFRYSKVPITDRNNEELFFKVIHSVIYHEGVFKAWYGAGNSFINIQEKCYPSYNIRYTESLNGIDKWKPGVVSIDYKNDDEYRVARPWVIFDKNEFLMTYYIATISSGFKLAVARSKDGIIWSDNESLGIDRSSIQSDWDSEMIAYPSMIEIHGDYYLFYNGNNYGEKGFGFAKLEKE